MGRRSRRLVVGGVVVAALLLLGRNLGVLPSRPQLPAGEPAPSPEPVPATPPSSMVGIDEDRLQRALSAARAALDDGRLGAGLGALDALLGTGLSPPQASAVLQARRQLEAKLTATLAELAEQVQQGSVLRAAARLRPLLATVHSAVDAALQALSHEHGWPDLQQQDVPEGYLPEPPPLASQRRVRTTLRGAEVEAPVQEATAAEVTLRLAGADGVTFPSVPVVQVEPLQPTAEEAAGLGLAALRAGDGALGRLWLCRALALSADAPPVQQLRGLLASGK